MRDIALYPALPREPTALIRVSIKELEDCGLSVTALSSPGLCSHYTWDGAELLLRVYPTALQDASQPAGFGEFRCSALM